VSLVQRNAFNGCNSLTSIEFPASLDKLEYFDDACLSGIFERHDLTIDRLDSITLNFHGIPISSIYAEGNAMLTSDVCYGQMYDIWTDDDLAALQLKKIDEETAKTSADTIIFVSGCYKKSDGTFTYEVVPKKNNSKWFAEYAATADGRDWLAHRKCIFVHIHYVLGAMTASYDYKAEKKRMLDIRNNVISKKNYSVLPEVF